MRPVSRKRAKRNRERKALIRRQHVTPGCQRRGCGRGDVQLHELTRGARRADAMSDPALTLWLCPDCHKWVTEHPDAAWDEGLALWGHEADQPDAATQASIRRL